MAKKVNKKEEVNAVEVDKKVNLCVEKKLNESECECKMLKKQIAGLRGENTKLKNILDREKVIYNNMCQEVRDLQKKLDASYKVNDLLHEELSKVSCPWYKRIFKSKK